MVDLSASANMNYKPSLYMAHKILDEFVVGEFESRMATFTNWMLANQHVNLAGQRSSGKTHIVRNVARLLPEKNGMFELTAGSDKAGYYEAEALKAHSHVMIPELNKLNKEAKETLKSWGEGVEAKYKTVVLEGGNRRVQTYVLPPRPFIFCLADEEEEEIDDQLRSRLTVIRTDISEAQNLSVMEQQAELALMRENVKGVSVAELDNMKVHIGTLPPWDVEAFRHPAAKAFIQCIPPVFTDCRRDFPKYLRNTYGITRFHWKERLSVKIGEKRVWIVTPADMYLNHVIYGNVLVESSLRCSNMERQLISILQRSKDPLDVVVLQREVRKIGMNISARMITGHMRDLSELGYVDAVKFSGTTVYKPGALFKDFSFDVDWKNVVAECVSNVREYYPEVAEEYVRRYCSEPVAVHPFVGVDVNILKFVTPKIEVGLSSFSKSGLSDEDSDTSGVDSVVTTSTTLDSSVSKPSIGLDVVEEKIED